MDVMHLRTTRGLGVAAAFVALAALFGCQPAQRSVDDRTEAAHADRERRQLQRPMPGGSPSAVVATPPAGGPAFVAAEVPPTGAVEGRPTPGPRLLVPGSPLTIVPFAMERPRPRFKQSAYGTSLGTFGPADGELFKRQPRGVRWHNAVLLNGEAGLRTLLLDRRGVVTAFYMGPPTGERDLGSGVQPWPPSFLLFFVVHDDVDGSGVLDAGDGSVLYLSDGEGRHLRQVTPDGTACWSHDYDRAAGRLYLLVADDSDGEPGFGPADRSRLMAVPIDGDAMAEPVAPRLFERAEALMR